MSLFLSTESEPAMDSSLPDVDQLARLYGRTVFQAAYRVLGDTPLAEDVQQDVFLRLLEKRVGPIDAWPAYLTTMTVRLAIDRLRGHQRWWRQLPTWRAGMPQAFDSTEHDAVRAERAQRLRAALARLKPREAECFTLRHVQGMEIAAIAKATGMTANHVGVCLHRAARSLEAQLGDTLTSTTPEVL
jgi:RNA polymerase sigma-70 factor (ECF subfamily)